MRRRGGRWGGDEEAAVRYSWRAEETGGGGAVVGRECELGWKGWDGRESAGRYFKSVVERPEDGERVPLFWRLHACAA